MNCLMFYVQLRCLIMVYIFSKIKVQICGLSPGYLLAVLAGGGIKTKTKQQQKQHRPSKDCTHNLELANSTP